MSKSVEDSQSGDKVTSAKYVDGVNDANMDTFLKALRSGEFNQVTDTLCRVSYGTGEVQGYCCLGVGSEVVHRESDELVHKFVDEGDVFYNGNRLLAPVQLLDWLGIPSANREYDGWGWNIKFFKAEDVLTRDEYFGSDFELDDYVVSASELNDDLGVSFEGVADVFENEFLRKE